MSEENVEIVRRVIEALNRGSVDDALKATADDFVFDFSRSISPERGVYGRDEIQAFTEAFWGVWESISFEVSEFITAGGRIITPIGTRNRGREGIELTTRAAWIWELKDGRIARMTFFQSRDEALEAAGLSE